VFANCHYSLNCHVGAMLVFRMLSRITQSSDAHRTESMSVMDHEQTMGVTGSDLYLSGLHCLCIFSSFVKLLIYLLVQKSKMFLIIMFELSWLS